MIKTMLAATAVAAFVLPAHAVTVVQWNFESAVAPAAPTPWTGIAASTGTGTASASHAVGATWSTPVGNGSARSIAADTWAGGDYWQFSFSTLGYTGISITFDQTSGVNGPGTFGWNYSVDGGAFSTTTNYSVLQNAWSSGATTAASAISLNLSPTAMTAMSNKSTVVVRLASQASFVFTGTNSIDNFTVTSPVPEASSSALLLAGLAGMGFVIRRRR